MRLQQGYAARSSSMATIAAVIPAYNEASRIGPVINAVRKYVDTVIVVDDHSADQTASVAKAHNAMTVRLATNMGAGFATRTGCDIAVVNGAKILITIDADGQHDPAEIPKLLKVLQDSKADIVYGSRPQRPPMPWIKRTTNRWGSFVISHMFGTDIKDTQTGFHVFSATCYPKLRWRSCRYGMVSEFVMRTGINRLKYKEVEIKTIYTDKVAGMSLKDGAQALLKMLWWRMKE